MSQVRTSSRRNKTPLASQRTNYTNQLRTPATITEHCCSAAYTYVEKWRVSQMYQMRLYEIVSINVNWNGDTKSRTRRKRTSGCTSGRSRQPTGMGGQGHMEEHQEARRCHIDLIAAAAGRERESDTHTHTHTIRCVFLHPHPVIITPGTVEEHDFTRPPPEVSSDCHSIILETTLAMRTERGPCVSTGGEWSALRWGDTG
jgi:hypothetical protein